MAYPKLGVEVQELSAARALGMGGVFTAFSTHPIDMASKPQPAATYMLAVLVSRRPCFKSLATCSRVSIAISATLVRRIT